MTNSLNTTVLVIGESAGGITAAVRAAREGLDVVLVTYRNSLGGVMPSLGGIETHYPGNRTPMVQEIRQRVRTHYLETYGENSQQYHDCISFESNQPFMTYEPHVLENIFAEMVGSESNITVIKRHYPVGVERSERLLASVILKAFEDDTQIRIKAAIFIDTTYEGDLAAVAGVPYRYGRESRQDYDELHAGRIFTKWDFTGTKYPIEAAWGKLNILPKWSTMGIMAGSTGVGDDRIQAYNYRLCISCDPDNRQLPDKPDGYNREDYLAITMSPEEIGTQPFALQHRFLNNALRGMIEQDHIFHGHPLPNNKKSWNGTNFPGGNRHYLESDWDTRDQIAMNHLNHALGIMYFLQNDAAVPEDIRQQAREWGLAKDEFVNNDNIPEQMYVREGRRIHGRYTFTQHDDMLAHGLHRAPIHSDSIGITEFPIDSLACSTDRMPGTLCDGQFFLMDLSRPGQIPFGTLLPENTDNLIVPVATSSTHVAWGTVRQTATLIHISEVAGFAAALSVQNNIAPGCLPVEMLQQTLVDNGVMLSFFNDFDMATDASWVPAVQYLGTKGFFSTYDAGPEAPLTKKIARIWVRVTRFLRNGIAYDAMEQAQDLHQIAEEDSDALTTKQFLSLLDPHPELTTSLNDLDLHPDAIITRGKTCRLIYRLVTAGGDQ